MALRAVGFDIDGTLYPDHRAQWRSLPFFLLHMKTVLAFSRTRKMMREFSEDEELAANPAEAEVRIFAVERGLSEAAARDIRDRILYQGWERYLRGMRIYSGVRDALKRLKESGLKLAALSDFPVGKKLEYFGLADLFDVIIGFPESGRLKPRPEPFLLMAERLDVEAADIIYVGNRLEYDVHGAEAAGMRGALIGPPGRKAPPDVMKYRDYRHMADSILSEVTK